MKIGLDIEYITNTQIKRSFKLIKKIYSLQQYELFIGKSNQDEDESEKVLKFQQFITKDEEDFINSLMAYQKSNEEQTQPSNLNKIEEIFNYNNKKVTVFEKGIGFFDYLESKKELLVKNEKEKICLDLSYSIEYLHKNSFMHLDLKPESFQKVEEKFKLSEFNQLRKFQKNQFHFVKYVPTVYSAPEIIQNQQKIADRADVWSLGCLFFEIFDGHSLFDINSIENLKNQQDEKFINEKLETNICNTMIKELIKDMLNINAENRISIQEVTSRLQNIVFNRRLQKPKQIQNIDNFQQIGLEILNKRQTQQTYEMNNQLKQEMIKMQGMIKQEIQKQLPQQNENLTNTPVFYQTINKEIQPQNPLSPQKSLKTMKHEQYETQPGNFPQNTMDFQKTKNKQELKQELKQSNEFNQSKPQFQPRPPQQNCFNSKINSNPTNFRQEKKQ